MVNFQLKLEFLCILLYQVEPEPFTYCCCFVDFYGFVCSFVVAMADLSLRKADVEEKRAKVQKESKVLLEYTRKAIAKLNDLKK